MSFTEIGAIVGFLTGVFTVWDRFLVGRPMVLIERTGYNTRDIRCLNLSKEDIIVTRVQVFSKYVRVSVGDSLQAIVDGIFKAPFATIVPAGGQAVFPLFVTNGALMDDDAKTITPFAVVVSWRKTRAMWLPQVPKFLFSSVRSLRRLNKAKSGQRPASDND